MHRWVGKTAIVTGSSSGIGQAIAETLADEGIKVVAVARRKDRLLELEKECQDKKGKIYPFVADITKEDDILKLFSWTKENVGPIHILVNNAGVSRCTNLTEGKTEMWKEILDTNVMGLCIATREAVQDMRANKVEGHIININSVGGHSVPNFPNFNVYIASKHAVTALTETLRNELNSFKDKIKVTSISPGNVKTEIMEEHFRTGNKQSEDQKKQIRMMPSLQTKDVANAVVYILSTPPHVQIHELTIKPVGEPF